MTLAFQTMSHCHRQHEGCTSSSALYHYYRIRPFGGIVWLCWWLHTFKGCPEPVIAVILRRSPPVNYLPNTLGGTAASKFSGQPFSGKLTTINIKTDKKQFVCVVIFLLQHLQIKNIYMWTVCYHT